MQQERADIVHCVSATKSIFEHYHVASFADLELKEAT